MREELLEQRARQEEERRRQQEELHHLQEQYSQYHEEQQRCKQELKLFQIQSEAIQTYAEPIPDFVKATQTLLSLGSIAGQRDPGAQTSSESSGADDAQRSGTSKTLFGFQCCCQ